MLEDKNLLEGDGTVLKVGQQRQGKGTNITVNIKEMLVGFERGHYMRC